VLENISDETQDISGLVFAGDEAGRFAATDWRSTLRSAGGSPERFRASGCVQLVTAQEAAIDTGCQRYNVWLWQSSEDTHFWIENEGNTAFVVEQNGEPIAECPLATRRASETTCEFALLSAEPAEEAVSDRPTHTPTRRPTATSRPTDTATPAAAPEIQLRYSSERIVLENISNRTQNISALVFEGDGNTRFAATEWITVMRDVGGSLTAFQSQGCVQLTVARSAAIDPGCLRYNVWTWDAAEDAHFWIESADNTEFVVRRNGVVIAECPAVAGSRTELTCEFALP
jgi:hypothetical protein